MIVRPRLHGFKMLFVWRGSVLRDILPSLGFILAVSIVALAGHRMFGDFRLRLNPAPFSLIGIALAIFLGFRNSASYDRFWEARKLWGALINTCRTLTRQAATLNQPALDAAELRSFVHLLVAFCYALKHQLRSNSPQADLARLLPTDMAEQIVRSEYRPVDVLLKLGQQITRWRQEGRLSDILLQALDPHLAQLSDILGGCERIAGTPLPYGYPVLLHRTVYFYCVLLPFGLVDSIGWATPVICVFVGYTFMAFDAIANEIEDPFGTEPNDLPLDALSRNIERSLLEMIGVSELPPPIVADSEFRLT